MNKKITTFIKKTSYGQTNIDKYKVDRNQHPVSVIQADYRFHIICDNPKYLHSKLRIRIADYRCKHDEFLIPNLDCLP